MPRELTGLFNALNKIVTLDIIELVHRIKKILTYRMKNSYLPDAKGTYLMSRHTQRANACSKSVVATLERCF